MLFSEPNTIRKHHKTFSCNFLGVGPFISYIDPTKKTIAEGLFFIEPPIFCHVTADFSVTSSGVF
jgi:hypothetical protein